MRRTEGKRPLGRPGLIWEDNIKMDLQEVGWGHGLDWSDTGFGEVASFCECGNEPSCAHKTRVINPLNPELNPICYLLALLGAQHFLHVSRIRVKLLTFRLLMSYIYIYIYIYIWNTHS